MNTLLREANLKRKDPLGFELERFRREMEDIKRQALADIAEAKRNSVFKDLEPARRLAKETAQEEIAEFKNTVDGQIQSVFAEMNRVEEDFKKKVDTYMSRAVASFESQIASMQKSSESMIAESHVEHKGMMKSVMDECRALVSNLLVETRAKVSDFFANAERFKGDKGDTGAPGKDGEDGSPDTAEQVVAKLNSMPGKVNLNVIAGLSQRLEHLAKTIRDAGGKGGGGQGNVQHETKAVNSGTTSVTTSYNVGGGGYAIWAYYQGQLVMRGTHYTVSGKTVTLLFTPQDNTYIDIIYIR